MTLLKLIAYGLGTWLGIVVIFRYTTYHRHFWKASPVLVAFAAVDGWLFHWFGLSKFGFEFLLVFFIAMVLVGRYQKRQIAALMTLTDEPDQLRLLAESGTNTQHYFWLSVVVFCVAWFMAWLAAFNS